MQCVAITTPRQIDKKGSRVRWISSLTHIHTHTGKLTTPQKKLRHTHTHSHTNADDRSTDPQPRPTDASQAQLAGLTNVASGDEETEAQEAPVGLVAAHYTYMVGPRQLNRLFPFSVRDRGTFRSRS